MSLQQVRNRVEQLKGARDGVIRNIDFLTEQVEKNKASLVKHEQAREVIRLVGLKTQQQLQLHISDIASLALDSVFDDPYELVVEFVQRRNKTECDLYFVRNNQKVDPLTASGCGAVDVAAFALRVVSWSMQHPHSENVIIMDEPMRFLSSNYQERASQMIKEISKKLGIQFVIITQDVALTTYADKIFDSTIKKGITQINESI